MKRLMFTLFGAASLFSILPEMKEIGKRKWAEEKLKMIREALKLQGVEERVIRYEERHKHILNHPDLLLLRHHQPQSGNSNSNC